MPALLTLALLLSGLPFSNGERVVMEIRYARFLAGRASMTVAAAERDGRPVYRFEIRARSEGFFARLFDFQVRDRSEAIWDPSTGCSLRLEKRLREGRARRDQVVVFDAQTGMAQVDDPKIEAAEFDVGPCPIDVLSAIFITRARGVGSDGLQLSVFDNGKSYELRIEHVGRERLDLPPPFGPDTETVVVEPMLAEGSGLFVRRGRLKIWLTDDERRIPVRWSSKVPIGAVIATIVEYEPGVAPR